MSGHCDADSAAKLSFEGKAKKLDNGEDAREFADAIINSGDIEILQLNGNTVGQAAADVLKEALKTKPTLKRLIWHDIFTGRSKEELPPSLKAMNEGVMESGCKLIEINLSDNAFGPAGVDGIKDILTSPTCFTLKELKLNNNGLGTFGARALSEALIEGYQKSLQNDTQEPFQLEVFIAGRNRLENPGCTDMSKVFEMMRSLTHIEIPQNGIQAPGISALASSLQYNMNLRVLNLNDNIITESGAVPLINGLKDLQHIQVLNLGDSLFRNEGALKIAEVVEHSWPCLETLVLSFCEIESSGAVAVANSLKNKTGLKLLDLNGNNLGENGINETRQVFFSCGKHEENVLGVFDEDQGEKEEDDDDDNEHQKSNQCSTDQELIKENGLEQMDPKAIDDFLKNPNTSFVSTLSAKCVDSVLKHIGDGLQYVEVLVQLFLDIAIGCSCGDNSIDRETNEKTLRLLDGVMREGIERQGVDIMRFCDFILEQCGLIKSENKIKTRTDLAAVLNALNHVVRQSYFTKNSRMVLRCFFGRTNHIVLLDYTEQQTKLMGTLFSIC